MVCVGKTRSVRWLAWLQADSAYQPYLSAEAKGLYWEELKSAYVGRAEPAEWLMRREVLRMEWICEAGNLG
jgi:hypothetical protein